MSYKNINNWDLAILTAVILILLFFWFYKFLFIIDPTEQKEPFSLKFITSDQFDN